VECKQTHGHCNVPDEKNRSLGAWVRYQRGHHGGQRTIGRNGELHCWQAVRFLEVGITSWWIEED
jgi:phage-related tail fiber protein